MLHTYVMRVTSHNASRATTTDIVISTVLIVGYISYAHVHTLFITFYAPSGRPENAT